MIMSAYPQFGYTYPAPSSQLLVSGQPGSSGSPPAGAGAGSGVSTGAVSPSGSASNSCCENGRPIMTDPVSGQTVCSCQLALSSYPRLSSAPAVYGTPYPSTDQNPYPSIDSSAFYSPLSNPYALKDGSGAGDMGAWTSAGLQPSTGYYPYDPTLAAYGYSASYDLAARRKNATRESTATLKAWLNEHKKNPYPTKGEKIMLAIITKMTLTQVSTWFANARRRLKKENKMTWEPKNKTDDDEDAVLSDCDEKEKDDLLDDEKRKDSMLHVKSEHHHLEEDDNLENERRSDVMMGGHNPHHLHHHPHHMLHPHMMVKEEMNKGDCGIPIPPTKPKIWSLADTAACKTPPPAQQQPPWCSGGGPGGPSGPGGSGMNGFALPSASMSPSAGASSPYSRYGGFFGGNYTGSHPGGASSGFPEVQTDTPPQTPPNMKLPNIISNNNSNSSNNNNSSSSNSCLNHQSPSSAGYSSSSVNPQQQSYPSNYGPRLHPQSPKKERAEYHQHQQILPSAPAAQAQSPNESTAFKPFYKSPQSMNGGYVSPV